MRLLGRFRKKKAEGEAPQAPTTPEHNPNVDEEQQQRAREIIERQLEEQRQHLPPSRE